MPPAVRGPLSHKTFYTAAKQHLRARPGGQAVAPGPRQPREEHYFGEPETSPKRGRGQWAQPWAGAQD